MRPSPPLLASMARIGTPPAVSSLLFSVVYLFLSNVMARFGTIALAALGIGNRLESISYLTAGGFGVAASTLVGQNLGAALPRRAERAAWTATAIIVVLTGIYSVLLFCFAEGFVRVFTSDPRVIVEAARFVRILSFCQAFMGVEIVLQGAFGGAGDTLPPTLISVPISLLRIPLAYLLALPLGFGPGAIWWLLSVSCLIRGLLLGLWFRRNRWMQKTLPAH
jgi:putative MATE family efflux protein